MNKMSGTQIGLRENGSQQKLHVESIAETMTIDFEPHIMSQYRSSYHQGEPLNKSALIPLVERLDRAGLYEWVTEKTVATDIIRLARWSLLGQENDWTINGEDGSAVRGIHIHEVLQRPRGHEMPDFFHLEIGWTHGTPWWDVIRHIVARAQKYDLFFNMAESEAEQLREMVDYRGKVTPEVIAGMAELGLGVETVEDIMSAGTLNEQQKASKLQENEVIISHILHEDWMQPWWPKAMQELRVIPEKPLKDCLAEAVRSTPNLVVHQHVGDLHPIFLRMGRYYRAYRRCHVDTSNCEARYDEAEIDLAMNWIRWGSNDECVEVALESTWQARSGFSIIIGGECRYIKNGEIMKASDEFLYPVRRALQEELYTWTHNLYQYLHLKK